MTLNISFELYSTDGCHLCEMAYELVTELGKTDWVKIVDIVDDDKLVEQYGISIPVIKNMTTGNEINWPFDAEQLAAFFQS